MRAARKRRGEGVGRRQRARRLPPAERRAHLLACALRVFARRGLGEARHAEIAAEARVSLSTVFFYFPTRAALVGAVLDEVARFLLAMSGELHARTDRPAPRVLLDHARAFAASVATHPDHARVWLDWSTSIRAEVWPRYLAFQRTVAEIIERTIARGQREGTIPRHVEPESAALLVVGAAHMVAQLQFSRQDPAKLERFLLTLVRAAAGGAEPEGAAAR
jgi:TetR/AcrR family hemagglutinin/protease transcriptional regulator